MNKNNKFSNCPICNSDEKKVLINLDCGNFDGSYLYETVKIISCEKCGHIYNDITEEEYSGLLNYYNEEYAPINISFGNEHGDRPGSCNSNTLVRYSQLAEQVEKFIDGKSKVLDVGCAGGGFLSYLQERGYCNLFGIDTTENYILEAGKNNNNLILKLGSAEDIPFENNFFDIIVIDQVLEHLVNPGKFFQEAARVLKKGGLIFIGLPDAGQYNEYYIFDFYWFLLREHLQHFDLHHLNKIAGNYGFELLEHSFNESPMMSNNMVLPNLNAVFKFTGNSKKLISDKNLPDLTPKIKNYIIQNKLTFETKLKYTEHLAKSGRPVYIWGISREFLYLYQNTNLKNCNIIVLLDTNLYKQSKCTFKGIKINDPSLIKNVLDENTVLIVTAFGHKNKIKQAAINLGFNGDMIINM